ncbi:MAG: WD40 repeat domain-containing protein [Candidatus Thorarchaeota archaeon]|jgi:WD40 repeat protein
MVDEMIPNSTLEGHEFTVWAVAVSPDCSYVVSGGQDSTVRIWDPNTGKVRKILTGHEGAVYGLTLTSEGQKIISIADKDLAVRVWDFESGVLQTALAPNSVHITTVAVTPDNRFVITGGKDGKGRIWNLENGVLQRVIEHHDSIYTMTVSPDGQYLISGSRTPPATGEEGLIWIWKIENGELLHAMPAHKGSVTALTMTADSKYILSGGMDGTVQLWDVETGSHISTMTGHDSVVLNVTVTSDGRHVVSGSQDGTVRVWQLHGGVLLQALSHSENVHSLAVSPDNRFIVTGSLDGVVQIWDFHIESPWIDKTREREEEMRAELDAFRMVQLRKVIDRYENIALERMATLLRFDNMSDMEDWLLDLPPELPVKIDGEQLIIKK